MFISVSVSEFVLYFFRFCVSLIFFGYDYNIICSTYIREI